MTTTVATTLTDLLADRAATDPGHVCLTHVGGGPDLRHLTAAAWHQGAVDVAAGLAARDLPEGATVGLRFGAEERLDHAVAWMGVLLAGGVAVPVPDHASRAQVDEVLAHADVRLTVTGATSGPAGPAATTTLAALRTDGPAPTRVTRPSDPAQILYTSGTTGAPKGVVVCHGDLVPDFHPRRRPLAHSRAFLHAFPMGSNAGLTMLTQAVVAHATGWSTARFDGDEVCQLVERHRIGTLFAVPAMLVDLLDAPRRATADLRCLRLIGSTAAPLPPAVASRLVDAFPAAVVINTYTSTEAAPTQTTVVVDPDRPGSLGRPTRPGDVRVTDADGHPLPADHVGSVWLRSAGPPRRYHRDEAASRTVFVDGWVRTGDRGRLDADGHLYLVDREDDVVVSGGFNVSSLAVEAALHDHPDVRSAAVVGVPARSLGQAVVAVVEPRNPVDPQAVRAFLLDRLARHEVPTRVVVGELPRNAAGKVDKRRLREQLAGPGSALATPRGVPPATPVEAALAEVWREVLGVDDVRSDDDFFALGGTSFTAARVAAAVSTRFGSDAPAHLAFEQPVLRRQAAWLASHASTGTPAAGPAAAADLPGALSALQEYFLRWMAETDPPRVVSAITVAVEVDEPLDHTRLARAVAALALRHDSLRTVFVRDGQGGHRADVRDDLPSDVRWVSTVRGPGAGAAVDTWIAGELDEAFDVHHGPLFRVLHAELAVDRHVVVLAVHHLVCDGWSMGALLRDLGRLYGASGDVDPGVVAGSSAARLTAHSRRQWPAADRFWRHTLDGAPPEFAWAPGRRDAQAMEGASTGFEVHRDLVRAMRDTASRTQVSMHAFVAACWSATLSRLCRTTDLVLMSPVPGRTEPAHDDVVGCAVQSLLLRIECPAERPASEHARYVQQVLSDAQRHQHHCYEATSRQVPYPAWLRYERWAAPAHLPGLDSLPWPTPRELMFSWPLKPGERDGGVPELALTESPDGSLAGWLVYNAAAYDAADVVRYARWFQHACDTAAHHPRTPLEDLWTDAPDLDDGWASR